MSKKKKNIERYNEAVEKELEGLSGIADFEQFKSRTVMLLRQMLNMHADVIDAVAERENKFENDILSVIKERLDAQTDGFTKAFDKFHERVGTLEWAAYSQFLMYRLHVLKLSATDEDKCEIAKIFSLDLEAVSKDYAIGEALKRLEREMATEQQPH